ncbi:hypothetical protein VZT92_024144 [Zoarces viviparus]|uniref:Uncharacterized protein n=1 Tax=Zoarces viviparus TaxID=48416 RepID=A0AAW1E0P6_ZOAVI
MCTERSSSITDSELCFLAPVPDSSSQVVEGTECPGLTSAPRSQLPRPAARGAWLCLSLTSIIIDARCQQEAEAGCRKQKLCVRTNTAVHMEPAALRDTPAV